MPTARGSAKRKGKDSGSLRSEKKREADDGDEDLDLSSDIREIMLALKHVTEKAKKDEQQKNEETIASVTSEIRAMIDDAKSNIEKERQNILKTLSKSSKECESSLRNEYTWFQAAYENFFKEKTAYVQTFRDTFSKYEDEKEKLFVCYKHQRKKAKATLLELRKACLDKITDAEESLKKKTRDDKSFSILRKSIGLFLEGASNEDFDPDE